ncbi:MAG: tandem-95 repeat protein [Bacteriovoracaceae bacterium]|nr:tandem-95 repeat protein [Bacteriovoracaceae bacterium]
MTFTGLFDVNGTVFEYNYYHSANNLGGGIWRLLGNGNKFKFELDVMIDDRTIKNLNDDSKTTQIENRLAFYCEEEGAFAANTYYELYSPMFTGGMIKVIPSAGNTCINEASSAYFEVLDPTELGTAGEFAVNVKFYSEGSFESEYDLSLSNPVLVNKLPSFNQTVEQLCSTVGGETYSWNLNDENYMSYFNIYYTDAGFSDLANGTHINGDLAMSTTTYSPVINNLKTDGIADQIQGRLVALETDRRDGIIVTTAQQCIGNNEPSVVIPAVTLSEDGSKAFVISATDIESAAVTIAKSTDPTKGTITGTNGNFTYTATSDQFGADSFEVTVDDGTQAITHTVNVTVSGVNDSPVASAQAVTTNEDTPLSITLSGTDVDEDSLVFTAPSSTTNAVLSLAGNIVTYTPNHNWHGEETFMYSVDDGNGASAVETVTVTVTSVNDVPVVDAISMTTDEDTAVTYTLPTVDSEDQAVTWTVAGQGTKGTAVISGFVLTYTPDENLNGADSVSLSVTDGTDSATGNASITINPINDAPSANDATHAVVLNEDSTIATDLFVSDKEELNSALTAAVTTAAINGVASVALVSDEFVATYTPNSNYNGTDTAAITVTDSEGATFVVTLNYTVIAVDDAPVAEAKSVSTLLDQSVTFTLPATDIDGDAITYAVTVAPISGTHTLAGNSVTYTPNNGYLGSDELSFTATANGVTSSAALISIDISAVASQGEGPTYTQIQTLLSQLSTAFYRGTTVADVSNSLDESTMRSLISDNYLDGGMIENDWFNGEYADILDFNSVADSMVSYDAGNSDLMVVKVNNSVKYVDNDDPANLRIGTWSGVEYWIFKRESDGQMRIFGNQSPLSFYIQQKAAYFSRYNDSTGISSDSYLSGYRFYTGSTGVEEAIKTVDKAELIFPNGRTVSLNFMYNYDSDDNEYSPMIRIDQNKDGFYRYDEEVNSKLDKYRDYLDVTWDSILIPDDSEYAELSGVRSYTLKVYKKNQAEPTLVTLYAEGPTAPDDLPALVYPSLTSSGNPVLSTNLNTFGGMQIDLANNLGWVDGSYAAYYSPVDGADQATNCNSIKQWFSDDYVTLPSFTPATDCQLDVVKFLGAMEYDESIFERYISWNKELKADDLSLSYYVDGVKVNQIDYGAIDDGVNKSKIVTIKNDTDSIFTNLTIASTADVVVTVDTCVSGQSLSPGASCTLSLEIISPTTPNDGNVFGSEVYSQIAFDETAVSANILLVGLVKSTDPCYSTINNSINKTQGVISIQNSPQCGTGTGLNFSTTNGPSGHAYVINAAKSSCGNGATMVPGEVCNIVIETTSVVSEEFELVITDHQSIGARLRTNHSLW